MFGTLEIGPLVVRAVLLVAGLSWCKEIFGRIGKDAGRLRPSDDTTEKGVIVFLWIVTLGILVLILRFVYGFVQ